MEESGETDVKKWLLPYLSSADSISHPFRYATESIWKNDTTGTDPRFGWFDTQGMRTRSAPASGVTRPISIFCAQKRHHQSWRQDRSNSLPFHRQETGPRSSKVSISSTMTMFAVRRLLECNAIGTVSQSRVVDVHSRSLTIQ